MEEEVNVKSPQPVNNKLNQLIFAITLKKKKTEDATADSVDDITVSFDSRLCG